MNPRMMLGSAETGPGETEESGLGATEVHAQSFVTPGGGV